jgi:hypothetical protein
VPKTTHPLLEALDRQGIPLTLAQRDRLDVVFATHDQGLLDTHTGSLRSRVLELETMVQRFEELIESLMR